MRLGIFLNPDARCKKGRLSSIRLICAYSDQTCFLSFRDDVALSGQQTHPLGPNTRVLRTVLTPSSVLFVFVLVIFVIVGISPRCRVARAGDNLVDATCPLLLQTSLKLYGIHGHVVFLVTFGFEGWARSRSSPSASAQYISASFRYWRLCRSDFAMSARRANSFAFAR